MIIMIRANFAPPSKYIASLYFSFVIIEVKYSVRIYTIIQILL